MPFVEDLSLHYPRLKLEANEIYQHPENRPRFESMAALLDSDASNVPTFMWCGRQSIGFSAPSTSGRALENRAARNALRKCMAKTPPEPPFVVTAAQDEAPIADGLLPGGLDPEQLSWPGWTPSIPAHSSFCSCC